MRRIIFALAIYFSMFTGFAFAGDVTITDVWSRATAPGQQVAGVYFDIESKRGAKLVGAQTSLTDRAELHIMSMDNGVMRMRQIGSVDLPAGETVKFKPGGYHVMLFDLKQPLEAGGKFALTLLVEDDKQEVTRYLVTAQVRNLDGSKVEHHHH
jgi:copper(I)-binding protein